MAQFGVPFDVPSEEYGPGITVSGAGFAPLGQRDRAIARAVGDARRRAESIASALGVSVGEVREVRADAPFEPRPCTRPGSNRCSSLEAVSAETTFAIAGGPTSDDGAREVTGGGIGSAPVEVKRRTSPAIRHALRAARLAAGPDAAAEARANAEAAAAGAGIPLGPLFSVVEASNLYGFEPLLGLYAPGRFCATVRRAIIRRNPDTGERRIVGHRRVHRCYKPRSATVRLDTTYLGS
jgi:hypothetical protein